ncbi:MarR family transcriptional regulator [Ligilactobacillus equi]|uniref:MarR family winged helix-turn-helix transcriptional regulator n=1 Tax=Ligilactobacillus equi TaxID=137357 RepID=UPI002ED0255E
MAQDIVEQIIASIGKLRSTSSKGSLSSERQWIMAHLKTPELATVVSGLSIVALHLLSELQNGEQTGIQLAQGLNVTRGGVTRAAKTLLQANLVATHKRSDDQKKIYYTLTTQGREVAQVHSQLHHKLHQELQDRLTAKYTPADLEIVASFLDDLVDAET